MTLLRKSVIFCLTNSCLLPLTIITIGNHIVSNNF